MQSAVERLEEGKTFEPGPAEAGHYRDTIAGHYADAIEGGVPDNVSRIFQVATEESFDDIIRGSSATFADVLKDQSCASFLSTDGGKTWERHDFPVTGCFDPWVILTDDGQAIVSMVAGSLALTGQGANGLIVFHSSDAVAPETIRRWGSAVWTAQVRRAAYQLPRDVLYSSTMARSHGGNVRVCPRRISRSVNRSEPSADP